MKKLLLSLTLLTSTLPVFADGFNMPSFGNNSSNWNMPNMNWGNNGNNNNSNWNMPNMNWGNNRNGSNWNMPNMNWGNNANNNGSNWNMPNMNWGNNGNSSNWNIPNMNWNNNSQPWAFNNNATQYYAPPRYNTVPNPQLIPPQQKHLKITPPQFIPPQNTKNVFSPSVPTKPTNKIFVKKSSTIAKIPMPHEVKGVILAPANNKSEAQSTK